MCRLAPRKYTLGLGFQEEIVYVACVRSKWGKHFGGHHTLSYTLICGFRVGLGLEGKKWAG